MSDEAVAAAAGREDVCSRVDSVRAFRVDDVDGVGCVFDASGCGGFSVVFHGMVRRVFDASDRGGSSVVSHGMVRRVFDASAFAASNERLHS